MDAESDVMKSYTLKWLSIDPLVGPIAGTETETSYLGRFSQDGRIFLQR